jgi:hypothetical protein
VAAATVLHFCNIILSGQEGEQDTRAIGAGPKKYGNAAPPEEAALNHRASCCSCSRITRTGTQFSSRAKQRAMHAANGTVYGAGKMQGVPPEASCLVPEGPPVSVSNWNLSYTTTPARVVLARDVAHVQVGGPARPAAAHHRPCSASRG